MASHCHSKGKQRQHQKGNKYFGSFFFMWQQQQQFSYNGSSSN
jgi:hypothetical protein